MAFFIANHRALALTVFAAAILMAPFRLRAQTNYITRIKKFHGTAKCCIFNSLLVRQIQPIGERWVFNMSFQPRPARESILAGDD